MITGLDGRGRREEARGTERSVVPATG